MNRGILISVLITIASLHIHAKEYRLNSPDQNISVSISISDKVYYAVSYKNNQLIDPSPLSMTIDGKIVPAKNPVVSEIRREEINRRLQPAIKEKRSVIIDHCNELQLVFSDSCRISFRAYNDGIAWRFATGFSASILVEDEEVSFNFAGHDSLLIPVIQCKDDINTEVDCFHTAYEHPYEKIAVSNGLNAAIGLLPALVIPEKEQPKMLITETGVEDYPGMYLKGKTTGKTTGNVEGNQRTSLKGIFPGYPLEFKQLAVAGEFRWKAVSKRADYLAETKGTREFPWRILIIAENDRMLAETDMVLRLSGEPVLADCSWIKPGKSTSEWLYANHIYGVDFKAGYNTTTYKYYIDFAHRFGLEYVLLDAGWSNPNDILDLTPEMDMEELTAYAREKNVGLVLWTSSIAMETQMDKALRQFQYWGIKGIMVDFFNRDDQLLIRSLQEIAKKAAEKHIFVDFHGVSKPEGIRGRYPNVMTREGLMAFENYKWEASPAPEYELTIPFTRMVAGPVDYEPGAMRNATRADFYPVDGQPMSLGTRIHQLAMFIVYESPYAKMGGNPSDYLKEPEYTQFIADIPTVWDETRVLDGKVTDYIVTLRKAENGDYYMGAMTDWTPREIEIDFSFLGEGSYQMVIFQDGINADTYASDYKITSLSISRSDKHLIKMAPGGGWVAHIVKE